MTESENNFRLTKKKQTRRGFVMTGGGAKGLYEAGVVQAFHLCNMSFDVITGSSIGAINSVAYAEYLYLKPELMPAPDIDAVLETIDQMDSFINALHNAWLNMPKVNFIDDSSTGPFGRLKDDLTEFDLDLPMLTRLGWWWTTPENEREPMPLMDMVKLTKELLQRVGGRGLIQIIKNMRAKRDPLPKVVLDTYLENLDIGTAFVTPDSEQALKKHFTKEHAALTEELLLDEGAAHNSDALIPLLPADRTLKQYYEKNIDVRLTRANFRTGLLEISAYVSKKAFAHKLTSFWRYKILPREGFPVTSFRLELPGNPVAIEAALASSRYPGVFSPFPLVNIYPAGEPENQFLYRLLEDGFSEAGVQQELANELGDDEEMLKRLGTALKWLGNENNKSFTGRFFPQIDDRYIDGGSIDNTPSNSAIDAVREDTFLLDEWRRDVTLDLYTVLLHKLPAQKEAEDTDLSMYDVVKRTLEINSAAKLTTDANYAEVVSGIGNRGEQLAEMLLVLLEAIDELSSRNGSSLQTEELYRQVRTVAKKYDDEKYPDGRQRKGHFKNVLMKGSKKDPKIEDGLMLEAEEILPRMKALTEQWLDRGLPLDLTIVKIHPDEMPLHTVAFTERLGFEREKGIQMITMGCYNSLWDLRTHLEGKPAHKRDEHDKIALELAQKWTGIPKEDWPKKKKDVDAAMVSMRLKELQTSWECQRTECIFRRFHCAHGLNEGNSSPAGS